MSTTNVRSPRGSLASSITSIVEMEADGVGAEGIGRCVFDKKGLSQGVLEVEHMDHWDTPATKR